MKIILALILSCILCFGQGFTFRDVAFVGSSLVATSAPVAPSTNELPTDVPGLLAWYKADSTNIIDGDYLTNWIDSSGNGYHLTSRTTRYPQWSSNVVNGLPAMLWDGSNDYYTNLTAGPKFNNGTDPPVSVFALVQTPYTNTLRYIFSIGNSGSSVGYHAFGIRSLGYWYFRKQDASNIDLNSTNEIFPYTWMIVSLVDQGTTGKIWTNAIQAATGSIDAVTNAWDTFCIGGLEAGGTASSQWSNYIAEIVIFTNAVSDSDRTSIIWPYFTNKYNLSL